MPPGLGQSHGALSAVAVNKGVSGAAGGPVVKKAKLGKDPSVPTDFLPDADREEEEEALKNQLKKVRRL